MRSIVLTACFAPLLAACVAPTPAPGSPLPPPTAEGCNAAAVQHYVGRTADAATVEAARREAGAAIARTLAPDQMVTMEYRGDRLNLHIDGKRRITRVGCN